MSQKICNKCGFEKELSLFYAKKGKCKACVLDDNKVKYRKEHPKALPEASSSDSKFCSKCRMEKSLCAFNRSSRTKDSLMRHCKACHAQINAKNYNPEQRAKYMRERRKTNPVAALICVLRERLNKYFRNTNIAKVGSAINLGCSKEYAVAWITSQFQEGWSWANRNTKENSWHIDHIIPLSYFDLTDSFQLAMACHYTNLRPVPVSVNLAKSNKLPDDFVSKWNALTVAVQESMAGAVGNTPS